MGDAAQTPKNLEQNVLILFERGLKLKTIVKRWRSGAVRIIQLSDMKTNSYEKLFIYVVMKSCPQAMAWPATLVLNESVL